MTPLRMYKVPPLLSLKPEKVNHFNSLLSSLPLLSLYVVSPPYRTFIGTTILPHSVENLYDTDVVHLGPSLRLLLRAFLHSDLVIT